MLTSDNKALWQKILSELEIKLSSGQFNAAIKRASLGEVNQNSVEILCSDGHHKRMVEKFHKEIYEAAKKYHGATGGKDALEIIFRVGGGSKEKSTEETAGPLFSAIRKEKTADDNRPWENKYIAPNTNGSTETSTGLSPKYVFENYLMGSNNQLAYAVAKSVAQRPGETYNPLFLYSGVGMGKTHLIQAIGNSILKEHPELRVLYTTGEAFTNEVIEAIQTSKGRGQYTVNKFRAKFRNADVLLVDDVQFIAGKEMTQEEFFHTFNTLYMAQKQIVLTSDRPPKDFVNLEDRIKSRFGSGMIADIQPPNLDMRIAILRSFRDENEDSITNDTVDFIAETITSNIRELRGAYMQVLAMAKATNAEVTKEFAAKALGQRITEGSKKPVNLNQILKAVSSYYAIKLADIKGARRTKEIVLPRQMAMYLIYEMTQTPFMSIGEMLGGRDHTTIMHGVRKIEEEIQIQGKTRQDAVNIKKMVETQ